MSMSRYLDLFLSESREHLAAIERDIAILDRSPGDAPALQELFRHAHSIKGMAASMGYPTVADLAHAVEEALDGVKRGVGPFDAAMKSAVLLAFDGIDRMIAEIETRGEPAVDTAPMYAALERLERRTTPMPAPPERGEGAEVPENGNDPVHGSGADARADGGRLISISVRFQPDSTLPSARAAVALRRLEAHGLLVHCAPSPESLANREFDGLLRVLLRTQVPPERLEEEIRRLTDVRSVEAVPASEAQVEAVPAGEPPADAASASPSVRSAEPMRGEPSRPEPLRAEPSSAEPSRAERVHPGGDPAPASTVRVPARSLDTF